MENILKAKTWQIFILVLAGLVLNNFTIKNQPFITSIINLSGILIYAFYPFLISITLQDKLPRKVEPNFNLFLLNSFIWIGGYAAIVIISDGQELQFSGLAALLFFYGFYSFIHFFSFPARTLKSVELQEKARLGDYFGDIFLLIFLPIGIWFIHPRVKQIMYKSDEVHN